MTDKEKGPIIVELVFDREAELSGRVLKLFVDNVHLLVSTICWVGAIRPPIEVIVSKTNHVLGGHRTNLDVSIMLKNRTIEQVSPYAINYGRILLLSLFAPFGFGVLLMDESMPRSVIARIGRDDSSRYVVAHHA